MPKLECPCGFVHDLTPCPDTGWRTVTDSDLDSIVPLSTAPADECAKSWTKFYQHIGSLYECPQCGRLIWIKPGEDRYVVYRRDE